MTLPALPSLGSTDWYAWASGVHGAVSDAAAGGAAHLRALGVVGDGTSDDTAAMQAAIDYAVSQGVPLRSDASLTILTGPLTVPAGAVWEGLFQFSARTTNQATVLTITGQIDFTRADVRINGENKALYGIRASGFGRSMFGAVDVNHCKLWGWQWDKAGNNNLVTCGKVTASLCGTKVTASVTETAETANVNSSLAGYATFTLGTALATELVATDAAYYLIYSGNAYRIRTLTTTTVEVFNLALGVGGTGSFDIILGGGLNIPSYGDNGVGAFGSLDIRSNSGIGIQQCSLYGHTFNNAVFQVNTIGFACAEYTNQTTFNKPYFEANTVDFVTNSFFSGVMFAPLGDVSAFQSISNRLFGFPHTIARLVIFQDQPVSLATNVPPTANPGARTIIPGQYYAFHRSGGSWAFTVDNLDTYDALNAYFLEVNLTHSTTTTSYALTISLSTAGETIEGGATYTGAVTGRTVLKMAKVGTDWKVSLIRADVATAITAAPVRIGQFAVVGAVGYIATGTAATTDWKQIT